MFNIVVIYFTFASHVPIDIPLVRLLPFRCDLVGCPGWKMPPRSLSIYKCPFTSTRHCSHQSGIHNFGVLLYTMIDVFIRAANSLFTVEPS